jgi:uncharacterized membrane protein YeaQ/YmgE (transglycosylase-associated protein family)
MEWLIYVIVIGALAGWIAGLLMKGRGFGCLANIVIGIIGAVIGGWLFNVLDITIGAGFTGNLVTATIGAIVLLGIAGLFSRR